MTHRNVQKEDFVGKTVTDLDCAAANILRFKFDDGTTFALEADVISGNCPVPIIQQCDHCGDFCEEEEETKSVASFTTIVDDLALRAAIRLWLHTPILPWTKGQDLYLAIIAHATQLPYEEVLENYTNGDTGLQAARRKTKRTIFNRLLTDPTSILLCHDAILVHVVPGIESGHGPQAAENHPR